MNIHTLASTLVAAHLVAVLALVRSEAAGQIPAAAGTWTSARTSDGQPDVQGYWDAALTGTFDLTDPKTGGRLEEILEDACHEGERSAATMILRGAATQNQQPK